MAGTTLGEAVTFDPSRELRPTPNKSIFFLNFKWQYTTLRCFIPPPPICRGISYLKKILWIHFSQRQANHLPAHSGVCTLRGGVWFERALSWKDSKSTCFHVVLEGSFKRMQRLNTSLDPSSEEEDFSFRIFRWFKTNRSTEAKLNVLTCKCDAVTQTNRYTFRGEPLKTML